MQRHIYDCASGCPVESTLQIISRKWESVILYHLMKKQVCRFSQLQKLMPHCSRRMLAMQLNELEQDNIIVKRVYPAVPPKTDYRLTSLGKSLSPVIMAMEQWGRQYNALKSKRVGQN